MAVTNKITVYDSVASKWKNLDFVNTTDNDKVLTVDSGVSGTFLAFKTPATSGTVTSVATDAPLTGGTITGSGTISLQDSGATAGTYKYPKVTVTVKGLISSIVDGVDDYLNYSTATLVASAATVTDAKVVPTSRVLMSYTGSVNAATVGVLYAVMGTGSFTINSNSDGDTNSVYYRIEY